LKNSRWTPSILCSNAALEFGNPRVSPDVGPLAASYYPLYFRSAGLSKILHQDSIYSKRPSFFIPHPCGFRRQQFPSLGQTQRRISIDCQDEYDPGLTPLSSSVFRCPSLLLTGRLIVRQPFFLCSGSEPSRTLRGADFLDSLNTCLSYAMMTQGIPFPIPLCFLGPLFIF